MSLQLHRIFLLSKWFILHLRPRRSYLIFLFFLVLSGIFWFATALNEYYDEEISVPVRISGIPKGLVVAAGDCDTIRVTIHDKGYNLLQYGDNHSLMKSLELDFSLFTRQTDKATLNGIDLQKKLQSLFGVNTTVVSVKPEHLDLPLCLGVPKMVPILLNGKFIPAENRYLADTIVRPRMATVYGTAAVLANVKYVSTEEFTLTNYSDTVQKTLKISKIPGTNIIPSSVKVRFCPDILMEQSIDIPVTPVNVPQGINLRTFPSRVKITYTAGMLQLKNIPQDGFVVTADYNDLREGSDKCPIRIAKKPKKVLKAKLELEKVDYLIENQ